MRLFLLLVVLFKPAHSMEMPPLTNANDVISIQKIAEQEYEKEFKKIEDQLRETEKLLIEESQKGNLVLAGSHFIAFRRKVDFFLGCFENGNDAGHFHPKQKIRLIEESVLNGYKAKYEGSAQEYEKIYEERFHDWYAEVVEMSYGPIIEKIRLPDVSEKALRHLKEWALARELLDPYWKNTESLYKKKSYKESLQEYVNLGSLVNATSNHSAQSTHQDLKAKFRNIALAYKTILVHHCPDLLKPIKRMDSLAIDWLKRSSYQNMSQKHRNDILKLKISGVQMVAHPKDNFEIIDELLFFEQDKSQCLLQ